MKKDKTELFEKMPIPKAVAQLSIPTVMGTLVMVLYNLADTYFVGKLNDPIQNAAVTLAAPVLLAFNAIINLFGIGTSSMMSRALGKKEYDVVRGTASFGFYCTIFCALMISVGYSIFRLPLLNNVLGTDEVTFCATADYLFWTVSLGAVPAILNVVLSNMVRAEGNSMHASIGVMSGCFLNIILDPFFILPQFLNMGAAGAGFATFLSNGTACLYFLLLIFVKRDATYVSLNPRRFLISGATAASIFGVGIPAAIQNLLNVTGMTILNHFTAAFGPDAVAAMGISHKVNMMPMYFSMGITQGVMPLISYNYASGDHKRMKESILFTLKISLSLVVVLTIGFFVGAPTVISLFMKNAEIIALGTPFLRAMCIGLPFMVIDFLAVAIFQAIGKGGYSLLFAILRKVVLEIPALFLLGALFPLYGLSYAQSCAEIGLSIVAVIVLLRLLGEKKEIKRIETENESRQI